MDHDLVADQTKASTRWMTEVEEWIEMARSWKEVDGDDGTATVERR